MMSKILNVVISILNLKVWFLNLQVNVHNIKLLTSTRDIDC